MATNEHLHHMMSQIGQQLDLGEVTEFEDENLWILAFAEDFLVEATYVEDDGRLVLAASIGIPAEGREAEIYKLLLQYNYLWEETGGARTALDASEGEAYLMLDVPVANLELPEFQACLENFKEIVPCWRAILSRSPDSADGMEGLSELGMPNTAIRV